MHAATTPGLRRAPRLPLAAALLIGVLGLHLWLLARWPAANPAGAGRQHSVAQPLRMVLAMPARSTAPQLASPLVDLAAATAATATAAAAAAAATATTAAAAAATAAAAAATTAAAATIRPPRRQERRVAAAVDAQANVDADAAAIAAAFPAQAAGPTQAVPKLESSDEPMNAGAAAASAGAAGAAGAAPGQAPPVYATRMPAPTELRYALQLGARTGQATLNWQHDGAQYRLLLQAQGQGDAPAGAPGGPLLLQSSSGGFDAAGLAPERFVDRRRGRGARAANFQRDSGRITFSAARVEYPIWPGAQDRLAWIVQLAAIANAAGQLPPQVALFVVDARGAGDVWTFVHQGLVSLDTPLGPVLATHLLREPQQLIDWRIEAWLDPQRGHWPVRLRMTVPRSGAVLELQLVAEPSPP